MRVTQNDNRKLIQIWCSQEERQEDGFWNTVGHITEGSPYRTVVYVSGNGSLVDLTADLLRHNAGHPTA